MKNRTPFVVLVSLTFILMFIVGIRYGQYVEKRNKEIGAVLSLTPKYSPTPTTKETVSFNTYKHKPCAAQLLYPSFIKKTKESSTSAEFKRDNDTYISFSCGKINPFSEELKNNKAGAEEVKFQNKITKITTITKESETYVFFNIFNPQNAKTIYVKITKDLYPLFENSLKFTTD